MKLMRYTGNASVHDATGAIELPETDEAPARPTVQMRAIGEFTDREVAVLSQMGYVLEAVDDGGLDDMSVKDLESRAKKEGIELGDASKKDEIVSVMRQALANSGEEQAGQAMGGTFTGAASAATTTSTTSASVGATPAGAAGAGTTP